MRCGLGKTEAVVLTLTAAFLFGAVNVVWRYADAAPLALSSLRAAGGVLLLLPLTLGNLRLSGLTSALADRRAWPALLLPGVSVWAAAWLFSTVTGSVAAATLALAPIVTLLSGVLLGAKRLPPRGVLAIVACTAFALMAASGSGTSWAGLLPAAVFLLVDSVSIVAQERARERHSAYTLTFLGLCLASLPAPFVLLLDFELGRNDWAVIGFIAAVGTIARLVRSQALATLPAAAIVGSGQVTALLTAVGGLVLFGDPTQPLTFVLLLGASSASVIALLSAGPNEKLAEEAEKPVRVANRNDE